MNSIRLISRFVVVATVIWLGQNGRSALAEIVSDVVTASNTVRQTTSSGTNYFMGYVGSAAALTSNNFSSCRF